MPPIARIEPLTTARALRGPFDYLLPPELSDVEVGAVLVVPFAGREVVGVVVERTEETDVPAEKLAAPRAVAGPGVPAELVALARWIADEYCSTPARALGLVLPPGAGRATRPRVSSRTALVRGADGERPAGARAGGGRGRRESHQAHPKQHTILSTLQTAGPLPAAQTGADHGTLRRLAERGLLLLERREQRRRPVHTAVGQRASAKPPRLTAEQVRALDPLLAALGAPDGTLDPAERRFLLHGVTGSGKTEVYLQAAAAALEAGRTVIVLVPEIALAPQTVGRFEARFGDTVAVLHSQLGQGERYDEWMRLRRGRRGSRSARARPSSRRSRRSVS